MMEKQIMELNKRYARMKLLKRIVALLCVFVMLFTVNSLKMVAQTLTRTPMCGLKEHQHKAKCYDASGNLVCGKVEHQHTDACYQESPTLEIEDDSAIGVNNDLALDEGGLSLDLDAGALDLNDDLVTEDVAAPVANEAPVTPTYVLGSKALLSNIIESTGLNIKIKKIKEVGIVDNDGSQVGLVEITKKENGDYRIKALRDFDQVELAIVLADEVVVVKLLDGVAPAEQAEAPAVEAEQVEAPAVVEQPEEQPEAPAVVEEEQAEPETPAVVEQAEQAETPAVVEQPEEQAEPEAPVVEIEQEEQAQPETPSIENEQADLTVADAQVEQPVVDTQVEAPATEQVEEPAVDAQTVDTQVEAPAVEEQSEEPAVEDTQLETPAVEDTQTEEPATEQSEALAVEDTQTEEPAAEQSEEPAAEQSEEPAVSEQAEDTQTETPAVDMQSEDTQTETPAMDTQVEASAVEEAVPEQTEESALAEEQESAKVEAPAEVEAPAVETPATVETPAVVEEESGIEQIDVHTDDETIEQPATEQGEDATSADEDATPADEVVVEQSVDATPAEEVVVEAEQGVDATPADEEAAPTDEEAAPADAAPTDVEVEQSEEAPADEETAPADEEAAPTDGEAAPADEDAAPADEEAPADVEVEQSVEESAGEEAAPADDVHTDDQAVDEDAAPTDGEAAPAVDAESVVGESDEEVVYTAGSKAIEVNDSIVTLTWPAEAHIPEDVVITIEEIEKGTEAYDILYHQALAELPEPEQAVTQVMRFFDITLFDAAGKKIEPAAPVNVVVSVNETVESDVAALHCEEVGAPMETVDANAEGESVAFDAPSFSVYGVNYQVPAEQTSVNSEVTVDLSRVDTMAAAKVDGMSVSLSVADLLEGNDAAVESSVDSKIDAEQFVADATVSSADVTVQDGTITLPAEALDKATVQLSVETKETDSNYVTTVTTHTVDIVLSDYAGRTEEATGEGVTVKAVGENSLPADAKASVEENVEVPQTVEVKEGEAATAFDINLTNANGDAITGPVAVTVMPTELNVLADLPEGTATEDIQYQLIHVHDDGSTEIVHLPEGAVVVSEDGKVESFSFETESFSKYVLKYTVDFEYTDEQGNKIAWSWPGNGSYAVADIMAEIGVEGEISDVSLERTEDVGGAENALYLEEKADGWNLTSEAPFQDTFELTVVVDGKAYVLVITDVVGESTNLQDFLQPEDEDPPAVSLTINGTVVSADSSNPTPVRTGDSFSLNLHFREINGGVQFADGKEMSMQLPAALSGFQENYTQNIQLVLNDTDPSGNNYKVNAIVKINPSTNTMTLQWPEPAAGQDRTAYDLLKASGNAYIDINITGTIGEITKPLVFKGGIERYIKENDEHSLTLSKNGTYDKASGRVNYTIQVNSVGNNDNVTVVDTIENQDKTALVFDSNSNFRYTVYNKDGSVAKATTTFTVSGNSFEQSVGNLTNGQYAVIEYSAKVDTTKITGTGTVEQTGNTVRIKDNNEVPPVTHNLNNQIDWTSVSKSSTGVTGGTDTNTKVAGWKIIANAEQRGSMAGKTITDTIGYNSRNIMTYADGITVKWYNGDTYVGGETINFSDNDSRLTLTDRTDNKGQSWTYTVPTEHSGNNYKYVITYNTNVDVTGQLQSIQVTNEVETEGKKGQSQVYVEPGIDKVTIEKKVIPNGTVINGYTIVTDKDYTSWEADIEIPSTGLSSAVLEDYLPKTIINGATYVDEFVPGTLLFGGDWDNSTDDYDFYDFSEDDNIPRIRIEFKKKSDGTPGLAGTGSRRTIKVYYQTRNDPTWVETYLPGSYGAEQHTNTAKIYVGDRSVQTQVSVVPPYPTVKKAAQVCNSVNIDGVNYPLYRYTVTLYGVTKDQINQGVTITDTHDSRLVYYPCQVQWDDEWIMGESGQHTESETRPIFSDNGTNMTITAAKSCFPMKDGEPYSYYTLHYYMRGKDVNELISDSMAAITPDGKPGKVEMSNAVEWDGHGDDVKVTYEYPGLDKQLVNVNGRVAQFKITLNPEGTMIGTSETLRLVDEYENLSVDYSTIRWEPSSVNISYNFKGNKGTYYIPNGTAVTLYYNARILGDGNVNFKNNATFGDWSDEVDEWRQLNVQGSGGAENYKIRIYKYASDHMEVPLSDTTFKLLDSNKQDMHPYLRDSEGKVLTQNVDGQEVPRYDTSKLITFTTGSNGYATVMLDSSKIGYALEKDKVYYLEETQARPGFERDYIQYSFEISDSVEYDQKNGVYRYYNNDILKVSNEDEQGGLIIVKSLSGINWDNLTEEEQEIIDGITFTIHGQFREQVVNSDTGAVTYSDPIEKDVIVYYRDFVDGRYRIDPEFLVVGASYTVTESSAAIEGYHLVTTYRADAGSPTGIATDAYVEFTEADFSDANRKSHRLSVNNDYSTYSYNFKKAEMGSLAPDFEDGPIYLRGAEFSSYEVGGDGTAKKVYRTDSLGEFGIRWIDHCYEYNKLYYVVETKAPDGYEMLPESRTGEYAGYTGPLREKYYFYFSNPEAQTPWTPASVPDGKTAYDITLQSKDEATIENGKLEEEITKLKIEKYWRDVFDTDISGEKFAKDHPEITSVQFHIFQVSRETSAWTAAELKQAAKDKTGTKYTTTENPEGTYEITYDETQKKWLGFVLEDLPYKRTLYGHTTYYGYYVEEVDVEGYAPNHDKTNIMNYSVEGGVYYPNGHMQIWNVEEETSATIKKVWIAPNKVMDEITEAQFKLYREPHEGEAPNPNRDDGWYEFKPKINGNRQDTIILKKSEHPDWTMEIGGLSRSDKYHLVETLIAPGTYDISTGIFRMTMDKEDGFAGGDTVTCTNTYSPEYLEVHKVWNTESGNGGVLVVKAEVWRREKGATYDESDENKGFTKWQDVTLTNNDNWTKMWKSEELPSDKEYEYFVKEVKVYDPSNDQVDLKDQYHTTVSTSVDNPVESGDMTITNTKYDGEVTVDKTWLNVDRTTEPKRGSSAEFILQRSEGIAQGVPVTLNYYKKEWDGYHLNSTQSIKAKTGTYAIFQVGDNGDANKTKYKIGDSGEEIGIDAGVPVPVQITGETVINVYHDSWINGPTRFISYEANYIAGEYEDVPGTTIVLPRDQNNGDWSYKWSDLPITTPDGGQYFYTVRETKINGWPVENSGYDSAVIEGAAGVKNGKVKILNTEKPGSLKLKKLVTVGGQPTEGTLADGTYSFTLNQLVDSTEHAVSGKSPITVTIEHGVMTAATVGGSPATVGEDGYVEVGGLEKGTYVLYEDDTTNGTTLSKLEEGYDRDLANCKITLNVSAGRTGDAVRVAAKGTFTNNIETGTLELNKQIAGGDANPDDEFTFEVSLTLPTGVHDGTFKAVIGSATQPDITTTGRTVKVEGIKLKGNQTYRISDLPIGTTYTIKETDANGYESSITSEGVTGTISTENSGVSLVHVTNTKNSKGSVQVTKAFAGIDSLPSGFKIVATWQEDGADKTKELTLSTEGVTGTGTTSDPYTWTIDNLPLDTVVTFTESGYDVAGYAVTITGSANAATATATATAATTPDEASFVNTYTELVNVDVTKSWGNGQQPPEGAEIKVNIRPVVLSTTPGADPIPVEFNPIPDGYKSEVTLNGGQTGGDDTTENKWKYTWSGLPKYSGDFVITYQITEASYKIGNEQVNLTGDMVPEKTGDGTYSVTLTNKIPTTDVKAKKNWPNGQTIPTGTTVKLEISATVTGGGAPDGVTITPADVTLDGIVDTSDPKYETTAWEYTWSDLPQYDKLGKKITYTVRETEYKIGSVDYAAFIASADTTPTDGYDVSFTNQLPTTERHAAKIWIDTNKANDNRPASITFTLSAEDSDGASVDLSTYDVTAAKVANEGNSWKVDWTNLPVYTLGGKEITYSVAESEVTGYRSSVSDLDSSTNTWTVTNTELTERTVKKAWAGDVDPDKITSITYTISRKHGNTEDDDFNKLKTSTVSIVKTRTDPAPDNKTEVLFSDNNNPEDDTWSNWNYTWTDLEAAWRLVDGETTGVYEYTVKETEFIYDGVTYTVTSSSEGNNTTYTVAATTIPSGKSAHPFLTTYDPTTGTFTNTLNETHIDVNKKWWSMDGTKNTGDFSGKPITLTLHRMKSAVSETPAEGTPQSDSATFTLDGEVDETAKALATLTGTAQETEAWVARFDGLPLAGVEDGVTYSYRYYVTEAQVSGFDAAVYTGEDTGTTFPTVDKQKTPSTDLVVTDRTGKTVYIHNKQMQTVALPATGGPGTTLYYVAGASLLLIALAMLVLRKKQNYD